MRSSAGSLHVVASRAEERCRRPLTGACVVPEQDAGPFAHRLAENAAGQIGPLVWEIEDANAARNWLVARGYRIFFEYDSSKGNAAEAHTPVHQLVLDPEQWVGCLVTLMERKES